MLQDLDLSQPICGQVADSPGARGGPSVLDEGKCQREAEEGGCCHFIAHPGYVCRQSFGLAPTAETGIRSLWSLTAPEAQWKNGRSHGRQLR
eukprot:s2673_g5.t1